MLNATDRRGSFKIQGVEHAGFKELFEIHSFHRCIAMSISESFM